MLLLFCGLTLLILRRTVTFSPLRRQITTVPLLSLFFSNASRFHQIILSSFAGLV